MCENLSVTWMGEDGKIEKKEKNGESSCSCGWIFPFVSSMGVLSSSSTTFHLVGFLKFYLTRLISYLLCQDIAATDQDSEVYVLMMKNCSNFLVAFGVSFPLTEFIWKISVNFIFLQQIHHVRVL